MSLLRHDWTTNEWVIFAPEREHRLHGRLPSASRPSEYPAASAEGCPFCPGNEDPAAKEIHVVREGAPPGSAWSVRVVPNKFPALRIEEDYHRRTESHLFRSMGGCGAHEVVVESPHHTLPLALQPVAQIERVLGALHERFVDLLRDKRFPSIVVFKNHGESAGTSLRHPHWQIIATAIVPRLLRAKHAVALDFYDRNGVCLYGALLEEEIAAGTRVIAANADFVAVAPYASHTAYEVWILPRAHRASFGHTTYEELSALAALLKDVLARLFSALDDPAYNLTIDTAPRGDEGEAFLWHMRIVPRLTTPAGFELGSGMSINTVLPETAAETLRAVAIG